MMDFEGAMKYIITRLINESSSKLYYHGLHHTLDVFNAAQQLAEMEGIKAGELVLVKTAALYHDAGFMEQYKNNEVIAVRMAKETLPQFGYSEGQIGIISGMILATDITKLPQTFLEKILCDADLDYLGRDDFDMFAFMLKKELIAHGSSMTDRQWDEIQMSFLEKHQYHTASARKLRETQKQKHLQEIRWRCDER